LREPKTFFLTALDATQRSSTYLEAFTAHDPLDIMHNPHKSLTGTGSGTASKTGTMSKAGTMSKTGTGTVSKTGTKLLSRPGTASRTASGTAPGTVTGVDSKAGSRTGQVT
jgi:hypothetical protein